MDEYKENHHRDLKGEEVAEEEEEALSLCDLPLDDDSNEKELSAMANQSRRSSSEPSNFFEFFNNLSSEMRSAEDIIFCGKLVPFKDPIQNHKSHSHHHRHHHEDRHLSFCRRSESLSGLNSSVSRSNSINSTKLMMRNSRSLDYRKLERFSSSKTSSESETSIERNSSSRSTVRGFDNGMIKRTAKPRWYVIMFGVVKPPMAMELRDIKSRQVRRNSSAMMFPPSAAESVQKPPLGKGSCRLLKVLSCRDNSSVAVTTSFCMPPA